MSAQERVARALGARYRVERELGEGGMATVYLAHDLKHDRAVAVKVLKPELAAALGAERFLHEIRVTARLQHPHILPLFDSGESEGLLYYVMPYVEGESLRDRITRLGTLPLDDALSIVGDVAAALTDAHARGIVHRDIKPENILVRDGEGVVADFGIALALSLADRDRLTGTGLSLGTPVYMSPEQVSGERNVDGRADVYSLGVVLFEALTGEPPFTGPTMQAVITKTLLEPPPSARTRRRDLPADTDAAIRRAMAKRPDERFDTPRAFIDACGSLAPPARRPRALILGLAAAVVVLAALAYPLWRSNQVAKARAQLPAIAALAASGDFAAAFTSLRRAERWLENDSAMTRLKPLVTDQLSIETEPAGARVYLRRIGPDSSAASADSVLLGTTPLSDVVVARGDHLLSIHKPGYAVLERIASTEFWRAELRDTTTVRISAKLTPIDSLPADMVLVPGGTYGLVSPGAPVGLKAELAPFYIDKYEVTNEEYAEFVRAGGYARAEFWRATPAGVARTAFTDRTGLPAPREWSNQTFPAGMRRHPVTNVSWHEANAYCISLGARLPTVFEWEKASRNGRSARGGLIMPWGYVTVAQPSNRANFSGSGTVPVDSMRDGISPFGVYAMAGNVKEWLANPAAGGFASAGGSWQDPPYLFSQIGSMPGTAARPDLGFRCARSAGAAGDQGVSVALRLDDLTPEYQPVNAAGFAAILQHYRYDQQPANPRHRTTAETPDWTRERLFISGVSGDSILLYLYLPKRTPLKLQTLVYGPSTGAWFFRPVWAEVEALHGAHIKAGRALLAVVLKGMLEREQPPAFNNPPTNSVQFRDLMVLHATELRLAMDYLATRDDIDMSRLAYLGVSRGAGSRLPFAGVDDRYRAVVLIGAGVDERLQPTLPEASNVNFAAHIKVPKLMVNGRNDEDHTWFARALPLWNLLRQPKELVLIDGAGHVPPAEYRVQPINAFLDRTLGPVAGAGATEPAAGRESRPD